MAGYSGTPLQKKLGIKPGHLMWVGSAPSTYFDWISPMPEGVIVRRNLGKSMDFTHFFVKDFKSFRKTVLECRRSIKPEGMIWVSWPKKSSGIASDMDENVIRDFALKNGLVDVKVCAVDDVWSGLKLVIPVKLRK